MGRLEGKSVIITGAASGIGAAAARLFVREGARLMLADLLDEPMEALSRQLGRSAISRRTDVTDEDDVKALVEETVARYDGLDAALLNAGVAGEAKPIGEYPLALFERVMAVNVRGVWLGLKYSMQAMGNRGGSIVVTASTAGVRATPNRSAYIASKHAAIGLMRAAAMEGAARGIRVNSVNPATIDTPMVRALEAKAEPGDQSRQAMAKSIPLARYGTSDEVANLMLFLTSDESSFCTGGVYMVDGGISAGRAQ